MLIESINNPLIKHCYKLAHNSKYREEYNQALLYGEHLVIEALKLNLLDLVLVLRDSYESYSELLKTIDSKNIRILKSATMNKINILDSKSSIIGLINTKSSKFGPEVFNQDCVILENIQDPGNLGTIFRALSAAAIQNIILSTNSVDIYNPKVLRASQGLQLGLNIYTDVKVKDFLAKYQANIFSLSPHAKKTIYQEDFKPNCALVFGNEGSGLSNTLLNYPQLTIPMPGASESLNLAMAVTVSLFELTRQRIK